MSPVPITIIVRHPKENPKKCSVVPLKSRSDIQFVGYPTKHLPALDGYVRLAADGPELSIADRDLATFNAAESQAFAAGILPTAH